MKKRIVILFMTVIAIASVITGCDPQANGTSDQSAESGSSISESTSLKDDKSSETSKNEEEVMRSSIKQKIDKAYEAKIKSDKAYSDWKEKYGDGKNVPKSEVEKAHEEGVKALAMIDEAVLLEEELIEMTKRKELNTPEMKYYMEKFGY